MLIAYVLWKHVQSVLNYNNMWKNKKPLLGNKYIGTYVKNTILLQRNSGFGASIKL